MLNAHALSRCREEYGTREHGTTGREPMEVFEEVEKPTLKPIPEERLEVPVWAPAHVHCGDQMFTFDKKKVFGSCLLQGAGFMGSLH